ncbi:hypothetical protein [Ralstonia syzygii]|uniref:hypothetical protein n=1 Tax=Ralstonia syzygii TaxID=28097 RepID=UPI00351653D6
MGTRLNKWVLLAIVSVAAAGCGDADKLEAAKAVPENAQPKLTAVEAKQLATDTLAYFNKYQQALGDDAVMNQEALLKVFNGPELGAILQRWPAPFSGDVEAEKYGRCRSLISSANAYAHAQHDFAFKSGPEKNALSLRKEFKQDLKDCKASLAV